MVYFTNTIIFSIFSIFSNLVVSSTSSFVYEKEWKSINDPSKSSLHGFLGNDFPSTLNEPTNCVGANNTCLQFGDFATLQIIENELDDCTRIEWSSPSSNAKSFRDCFELLDTVHWYGGGTTFNQGWAIERDVRPLSAFVTGDYTSTITNAQYGGIIERFFLLSSGVAIHIDETVPLFVSWEGQGTQVCFVAEEREPFKSFGDSEGLLRLSYDVCLGTNIRTVYEANFHKYYPKADSGQIPDEEMLLKPFWSTWNEFNAGVNQSNVLAHAEKIRAEGYTRNSHFEIDDGWETCYGESRFDPVKFPDPKAMVETLKTQHGFRVTLWTHPFINVECEDLFQFAVEQGYLLKDPKGKAAITSWWHNDAGVVDFTNSDAVAWWKDRLEFLRTEYGIDSFKFDAGEVDRLPDTFVISGSDLPNDFSAAYVKAVSSFGPLIEVRTGSRNQDVPICTRMLDKGSRWGRDNGLQSLIPSLLTFSILGYTFTLPDMVGGNNYKPSVELYIRWVQANVFMPAIQFSIVPWGYNDEDPRVNQITKSMLSLRETYENVILELALIGQPIIRPLWWLDPEDSETYLIDNEFLLGDSILVAPIVEEGGISRDIYLPIGDWKDGNNGSRIYNGPIWVNEYSAPLEILPYFVKI